MRENEMVGFLGVLLSLLDDEERSQIRRIDRRKVDSPQHFRGEKIGKKRRRSGFLAVSAVYSGEKRERKRERTS